MSAAFVGGFLFMACGYVLLRCGMPIPVQQQTCCTLRRKHLACHRLISASVVCLLLPTGSPPWASAELFVSLVYRRDVDANTSGSKCVQDSVVQVAESM